MGHQFPYDIIYKTKLHLDPDFEVSKFLHGFIKFITKNSKGENQAKKIRCLFKNLTLRTCSRTCGQKKQLVTNYQISMISVTLHAVYFISNAAKMRLVLNFSIFRVVAYFRCLASQNITVIAQPKMHKNRINLNISEKIGENKKKTVIFGFFVA